MTTVGIGFVAWQIIGAVLPIFPTIGCFCMLIGSVALYHIAAVIQSSDEIESKDKYKELLPDFGQNLLGTCGCINSCTYWLISQF